MTWWRWRDLCSFYGRAVQVHKIDSPSIYALVSAVFARLYSLETLQQIEGYRESLKQDGTLIYKPPDLGAPSQWGDDRKRKVKDEVAGSSVSAYEGRRLHNLVAYCEPKSILELGTSFGISTLYIRAAAEASNFTTVEGNADVHGVTKRHMTQRYPKVNCQHALFSAFLDDVEQRAKYDLVFLDGDHRYQSTLHLMTKIRPLMQPSSIVVLHDIHWSSGMYDAWTQLHQQPWVTQAIDFYHFGVLMTAPVYSQRKCWSVVPQWAKPWQLGVWR